MPLLKSPVHPYAPDTRSPYTAELAKARELFDREIDNTEGWEDLGDKDDVRLEKKIETGEDASSIPLVRGTCIVQNATTDELVPIIQTPGVRKKWDPRFETAWIVRRFSDISYEFYSLGNMPPALKWLIWPRDICGVHQTYVDGKADDSGLGQNKEIVLMQTSVKDDERASSQSGKTRMTITLSSFRLTPQGKDVKVTYLVKVSLGGSIPAAMVAAVIVDLPLCAGKVRNTYEKYGYPPYVKHDSQDPKERSILQTDFFHFGSTKNDVHVPLKNDKNWHLHMTGKTGGNFKILYDRRTMYGKEGGVHFHIMGDGKDGVVVVDDGNGVMNVRVGEHANGKTFEIIVQPHNGQK